MNSSPIIPSWKWGTAEGSREFDRLLDRRMSFREKIIWLEEAHNLTIIMAASREKLKANDHPPQLAAEQKVRHAIETE